MKETNNNAFESINITNGQSMTPEEILQNLAGAVKAGKRIMVTVEDDLVVPPSFPLGELLGETYDGSLAYGCDPAKILAWLMDADFVEANNMHTIGDTQ